MKKLFLLLLLTVSASVSAQTLTGQASSLKPQTSYPTPCVAGSVRGAKIAGVVSLKQCNASGSGWDDIGGGSSGATANATVGAVPYLSATNTYSDSQLTRVDSTTNRFTGANYTLQLMGTSNNQNLSLNFLTTGGSAYAGMQAHSGTGLIKFGGFNVGGYYLALYSNNAARLIVTPNGLIAIGDDYTSAYPALKRNSTTMQFRLGDDSGWADVQAGNFTASSLGTGIAKVTSGVFSVAAAGTDYAPATSGSSILKGNGSGGFSNAVSGTDYAPATSGSGILKGNGSGGTSTATAGTDYTSPSSTETQTNKTIDAEGTGNTITVPVKIWLLAGGCNNATAASMWDLPTSAPAVPACVTGSNIQKGVLDFADTGGSLSAQNTLALPSDFTGNIDISLYWTTSATSGNAKWSIQTAFTATNATETDDPSFNTASTVTTAAPGTAHRVQISTIISVTATGAGASKLFHIKVSRNGGDGSDTIGATARLIGVEVTLRRAM